MKTAHAFMKLIGEFAGDIRGEFETRMQVWAGRASLLDAVNHSEFETQLRALSRSDFERDKYRQIAIRAAQYGLYPDDAEAAFEDYLRKDLDA